MRLLAVCGCEAAYYGSFKVTDQAGRSRVTHDSFPRDEDRVTQ